MANISYIEKNCKEIEEKLINKFGTDSRIAIIGVGNELRYDDIAGLQVVRNLKKFSENLKPKKTILLVEGETAPHNFINEIKEWTPSHLIMLDSADLKKPSGTIEFIDKDEMVKFSISSHTASKTLLLDFLSATLTNLEIIIIGIQAENISYGRGISENIKMAVEKVTKLFKNLFYG